MGENELFTPDEGYVRKHHEVIAQFTDSGQLITHAAPKMAGDFTEDDGKLVRSGQESFLFERLMNGWNLSGIKMHMVDASEPCVHYGKTVFGHSVYRVTYSGLLPSVRCIQETFSVSYSTAKRALDMIREVRCIHRVDRDKRALRGDALQRFLRQQDELKDALIELVRFEKRLERSSVKADIN
jgi:hypothetical protein